MLMPPRAHTLRQTRSAPVRRREGGRGIRGGSRKEGGLGEVLNVRIGLCSTSTSTDISTSTFQGSPHNEPEMNPNNPPLNISLNAPEPTSGKKRGPKTEKKSTDKMPDADPESEEMKAYRRQR